MSKILISIHKAEYRFNTRLEHLFSNHIFLGYLTVIILMPILLLGAVFVSSGTIILFLGFLLGWY